jgi:hypothetical protein
MADDSTRQIDQILHDGAKASPFCLPSVRWTAGCLPIAVVETFLTTDPEGIIGKQAQQQDHRIGRKAATGQAFQIHI